MNHAGMGEDAAEHGPWLASVGYRFFKSDRHFIGGNESRNAAGLDRFQQGTEVINYSQFIDTSVTYQFNPRLSASLVLPWVHHIRSAPYEHSGVRRDTGATGIGDIRAVVGYWLWDPKTQPKGNLQVSLGGKAPTGDYQADDIFFQDQDPTSGVNIQPVRRNVDQSIQPGDGGWGVSWELNGYRELTKGFFAYAQAYYLFNPQNVNGVKSPTARSDAGPRIAGTNIDNGMSITDQYMFRAGFNKVISEKHNLSVSLGGRMEGIPVEDLNGNAGNVAKLLGAVFGVPALSNKTFVGIGLEQADKGLSYSGLATLALGAAGANTPAAIVDRLWSNLFGSAPSAQQAGPYVAMLESGQQTPGSLVVLAADLALNTTNINLVGLQTTGIHYS